MYASLFEITPGSYKVCFLVLRHMFRPKQEPVFSHNVVKSKPLSGIDHIYMESGHYQMECDTVHSTIERALKTQDVYNPGDYYCIVAMARQRNPCSVRIFSTQKFLDFKVLGKSTIRNRNRDMNGDTAQWLKIK